MSRAHHLIALVAVTCCTALVAASREPQQCTPEMQQKCRYTSLQVCGATEWPAQQTDNHCCPNAPTCRLPESCDVQTVAQCDLRALPECAPNEEDGTPGVPERTGADACCPTCRRAPMRCDRCRADPRDLPRCAPGAIPSIVPSTGCLSCRPEFGRIGNCTLSSLVQCAQSFRDLPECSEDDDVQRANQDVTRPWLPTPERPCCLTCRPRPPHARHCNVTTIADCHRGHGQLPICQGNRQPEFDRKKCCRKCRRPDPAEPDLPDDDSGRCDADKLRRCFRTLPVCADGERPYTKPMNGTGDGGAGARFCCPECRRPERTCSLEDVVRCRANQPDCADGETPAHVDGECCATCKPVRAPCTNCTDDSQMCVYGRDVTRPPTCAPKVTVSFVLSPSDANPEVLAFMTSVDVGHLVHEIVARFCDHTRNTARCQRRATQLRNTQFDVTANGDGSYTVRITFPDVPNDDDANDTSAASAQALRDALKSVPPRLRGFVLSSSAAADTALYLDAASDPEAADGYSASANDDSGDAPRGATAAGAVSVVLALVGTAAVRAI